MATIRRFTVHGLAGRRKPLSQDLHPHLNVFWGLNGSGKTTLLKILHSAMSNDTTGLADLPFESAEVVIHSDEFDADIHRTFEQNSDASANVKEPEVFALEDEATLVESWAVAEAPPGKTDWKSTAEAKAPERSRTARFSHSYLPISRVQDFPARTRFAPANRYLQDGPVHPDELFVRQVTARWLEYSSKSLVEIRDVQQQGLATVLAILFGGSRSFTLGQLDQSSLPRELPSAADAYDLVKSFLREQRIVLAVGREDFLERYETTPDLQQVVSEIQEVVERVAVVLGPQREFQSVIDEMFVGNKHLRLSSRPSSRSDIEVRLADKRIPLKSLSSGEKQLLQVLLEILAAGKSPVLIDEPELSLHVDWQKSLVRSMHRVNSKRQLLLATHSPEIVSGIPSESTFEL